jgi:anti-anti-sigma regulatory factor
MTAASRGKVVAFPGVATPRANGGTIVRHGELTRDLVWSLEQEIRNTAPGDAPLILDLRDVTYGDDGGLEALAALYQAIKAEGRKLEWRCSDERIKSQLRRCGLLTVFQGYGEYL